jgi:hypothetical protein
VDTVVRGQAILIFFFCHLFHLSACHEIYERFLLVPWQTNLFLKSAIFWDIPPCSPLIVNRGFGGTYRLHLQGRKNKFSKKPAQLNGLHGVISQKMVLFIITAVKISNPTTYSSCSEDMNLLNDSFRRWKPHVPHIIRFEKFESATIPLTEF